MQERFPVRTGPELVAYREHVGVHQEDIATALGKTPTTLWRWETGKTRITHLMSEQYIAACDAIAARKKGDLS